MVPSPRWRSFLLPDESARGYALVSEAMEIAAPISRNAFAGALGIRTWFLAGSGDWRAVLREIVDVAELLIALGETILIDASFRLAGLAFAELGHPETAVILVGTAKALADRPAFVMPWVLDLCDAADVGLVETLGEHQVATLTARGAALSARDAVAYLRAETDRVLGDEEQA